MRTIPRRLVALGLSALFLSSCLGPTQARDVKALPRDTAPALKMADFILALQSKEGAIADSPGAATANNDSNMEYALMALGAAYSFTRDARYLTGLQKGIAWLADREDMTSTHWRGSWYLQYSATPPYREFPAPGGPGATNVRGVDATSALFVYLLYLDHRLTGSNALVRTYYRNAQAALDFVITRDLARGNGLSSSSWLYYPASRQWRLYKEEYAADQGDVYLGMRAASLLYHSVRYAAIADTLRQKTPVSIFNAAEGRYALGLSSDGTLDNETDGYDEGFTQGYLSWIWGNTAQDRAGMKWLRARVRGDGAIVTKANAPAYSLNVAMLGLGDIGVAVSAPGKSFSWMLSHTYDARNGGVYDSLRAGDRIEYDNVAAFCSMGLLRFAPFTTTTAR